jgi:AcrR family transcriptional regulator
MARVIKDYDERHNEILECAQALFYSQGYEQTSIQDIIDAVGIAKGTFYHYFNSKSNLLDELIRQMLQQSQQLVEPLLADDELTAVEKVRRFFSIISDWKTEKKSFLLRILAAYYDDNNVILRHRMKIETNRMMAPILSEIIRQGVDDGSFETMYAAEMGEIVLTLAQSLSEPLAQLLLDGEGQSTLLPMAEKRAIVHQYALEKLLGAPQGSLPIIEMTNLRQWFA